MEADSQRAIPKHVLDAASDWLARRDRGLTASEQDDYMQWLAADPQHAQALAQHAAALERMMQLYEWTPAHDTEPNPDLFKPAPARRSGSVSRWLAPSLLAAAASLALATFVWKPDFESSAVVTANKSYLRVNERLALPDGSRVELKDGTELVVQYSENERRVVLTGGEAHFSVWKDPQRPFIVDAAGVEVRAVGTAFNVRLDPLNVQVLVTEGKVAVAPRAENLSASPDSGASPRALSAPLLITVGEQATVSLRQSSAPQVAQVTVAQIARELAWQAPRLQFEETSLAEAVAEFNRLNRHQLVLAEPSLGALRIGGTFRPDNVEGFIRLLDKTLGLQAESIGENRTQLRRR